MKILSIILSLFVFNIKIVSQEVETNEQGKYVKYYPNGQMMVEGYKTKDNFNVNKYGFEDGSYAIKQRDSSHIYYNLYSSSDNFICSTRDTVNQFDKIERCNCPKVQSTSYTYPGKLEKLGLEGIVILRLWIDTEGKLEKIEPLKGFHEQAINAAIQSVKKINCYGRALKNNIPVEYQVIQVINYNLTESETYSRTDYSIEYKCDKK